MIAKIKEKNFLGCKRFRLLNSEIGNDPYVDGEVFVGSTKGFRLLNSEIGNDLIMCVQ